MSELAQFLQNYYPGLALRAPLFYSWSIGIRFNLQSDASRDDGAYFQEVLRRATLLFQHVFRPEDEVLVVHQRWRGKRYRIQRNHFLLQQLRLPKQKLSFQQIANPYPQAFQPGRWNRVCALTTAQHIPHSALLEAISHRDFPARKPVLHGNTFFLNQRTGVIFHMYDDRGLDIIGPTASAIRPLYEQHQALVLDFDRKKIEAVFA